MMKILFRKLAKGKLACVYMPPKLLICQIIQNQTTTGSHFLGETKIKNQNKIIAGSGYFKNLQEVVAFRKEPLKHWWYWRWLSFLFFFSIFFQNNGYLTLRSVLSLNYPQNSEMKYCKNMKFTF
jgi:hypothetical protein